VRLECGRAFLQCEDAGRAKEVLIGLATDPAAPRRIRASAFDLLMPLCGRQLGEWGLARELHEEWLKLAPIDSRASAWMPTGLKYRSTR
jgi:hypothetical protein